VTLVSAKTVDTVEAATGATANKAAAAAAILKFFHVVFPPCVYTK